MMGQPELSCSTGAFPATATLAPDMVDERARSKTKAQYNKIKNYTYNIAKKIVKYSQHRYHHYIAYKAKDRRLPFVNFFIENYPSRSKGKKI
jgi:hypothetical protein